MVTNSKSTSSSHIRRDSSKTGETHAAWFETMEDAYWLHPDDFGEDEAEVILEALKLKPGSTVLDAPCGAGRITCHLAKHGCLVTGIDLRADFLRRARKRFRSEGLKGNFKTLDLRKLSMNSEFDGIANWSGSFGYFSDTENYALLAAFVRALRPGGRLAVEQVVRNNLLRFLPGKTVKQSITIRSQWDKQNQRMNTWRTGPDFDPGKGYSSLRLYTPTQLRRLFEQNGLEVEQIIRPVYFKATGTFPRMVVVGRKPTC